MYTGMLLSWEKSVKAMSIGIKRYQCVLASVSLSPSKKNRSKDQTRTYCSVSPGKATAFIVQRTLDNLFPFLHRLPHQWYASFKKSVNKTMATVGLLWAQYYNLSLSMWDIHQSSSPWQLDVACMHWPIVFVVDDNWQSAYAFPCGFFHCGQRLLEGAFGSIMM